MRSNLPLYDLLAGLFIYCLSDSASVYSYITLLLPLVDLVLSPIGLRVIPQRGIKGGLYSICGTVMSLFITAFVHYPAFTG